jgi:hypothetical protein
MQRLQCLQTDLPWDKTEEEDGVTKGAWRTFSWQCEIGRDQEEWAEQQSSKS